MKKLLVITLSALLVSCASTNVDLSKIDYLDVSERIKGNIEKKSELWKLVKSKEFEYPYKAAMYKISGCAEAVFLIDSDGRAKNITVRDSYPSSVFNRSVMQSLRRWKWEPTEINKERRPVLTYAVGNFDNFATHKSDGYMKHCEKP